MSKNTLIKQSILVMTVILNASSGFSQAEEKISCDKSTLQKYIAFANADFIKTYAQFEKVKESWIKEKSRNCYKIPAIEKSGYRLKVFLEPTDSASDEFKVEFDRCGVVYSFYENPRHSRLPDVRRYTITAEPECGLE